METQLSRQSHPDQHLHRGLRQRDLNQQHLFHRAEGLPHEQSAPVHIIERPNDLQRTAQPKSQQQHFDAGGRQAGLKLSNIIEPAPARWFCIAGLSPVLRIWPVLFLLDRDSALRAATSNASGPSFLDRE